MVLAITQPKKHITKAKRKSKPTWKTWSFNCILLYTVTIQHRTSSGNLSSRPPDSQHCSAVQWRVRPLHRRSMYAWNKRWARCVVQQSASMISASSWMTDAAAAAAVAALPNRYSLIKGRHVHSMAAVDWVRLNVPPTQYRSYRDGFLRVNWPNQECQSSEGTAAAETQDTTAVLLPDIAVVMLRLADFKVATITKLTNLFESRLYLSQ